MNDSTLKNILRTEAEKIYQGLIPSINRNNCRDCVSFLKKLLNISQISQERMLKEVSDNLFNQNNDIAMVFNSLIDAKFPEYSVLAAANVAGYYMELILNNQQNLPKTLLYDDFAAMGNTFFTLKDITGIQKTDNYIYQENYNPQKFMDTYRTLQILFKKLKNKYNSFALEQFRNIEKYIKIWQEPYDYLILEKSADKSPAGITKSLLEQKIQTGSYLECIALLSKKLEYLLKKKYNKLSENITLGELLNEAGNNDKSIPNTVLGDLCRINELRINKLHATLKQIDYDREKMMHYISVVFDVEKKLTQEGK